MDMPIKASSRRVRFFAKRGGRSCNPKSHQLQIIDNAPQQLIPPYLVETLQTLAKQEGIPVGTLIALLLKAGLAARQRERSR
jgi:hypothetical protein